MREDTSVKPAVHEVFPGREIKSLAVVQCYIVIASTDHGDYRVRLPDGKAIFFGHRAEDRAIVAAKAMADCLAGLVCRLDVDNVMTITLPKLGFDVTTADLDIFSQEHGGALQTEADLDRLKAEALAAAEQQRAIDNG